MKSRGERIMMSIAMAGLLAAVVLCPFFAQAGAEAVSSRASLLRRFAFAQGYGGQAVDLFKGVPVTMATGERERVMNTDLSCVALAKQE